MSKILTAICTAFIFIFTACETPTEYTAEEKSIAQLSSEPGYAWLNEKINRYTPNPVYVQQIRTAYTANPATFTLFVNPSCGCMGTQEHFPRFISSIRAAGIPESAVVIYSMRGIDTKHPKTDLFSVTTLPTFFVTRGTSNVGKIIATADTSSHIDSTLATIISK